MVKRKSIKFAVEKWKFFEDEFRLKDAISTLKICVAAILELHKSVLQYSISRKPWNWADIRKTNHEIFNIKSQKETKCRVPLDSNSNGTEKHFIFTCQANLDSYYLIWIRLFVMLMIFYAGSCYILPYNYIDKNQYKVKLYHEGKLDRCL